MLYQIMLGHEFYIETPLPQRKKTIHAPKFCIRDSTRRYFISHQIRTIVDYQQHSGERVHSIRGRDKCDSLGAEENEEKRIPVQTFDKYDPFAHTNGNKSQETGGKYASD